MKKFLNWMLATIVVHQGIAWNYVPDGVCFVAITPFITLLNKAQGRHICVYLYP